ncbi:creatininase family protein [Chloroflexota bacterium]
MKGIKASEITFDTFSAAIEQYPVALLPIGGGTKEHGPHLPLGTDQMVVDALAERVVEASPVLLLPTVAYAYYPAFTEWPGSVSIEAAHFIAFVGDIIRSMHRHGLRKFLILDGGVSTHPPLNVLSRDLHNELDILVAVTDIRGLGAETHRQIAEQPRGGHADELETSRMLALRPDLVHIEQAPAEYGTIMPGTFGPTGIKKIHVGGKMRTPHGINGDATLATYEKGEQSLNSMAQDIIIFIEHFVTEPMP